jgi:hypothetical protein
VVIGTFAAAFLMWLFGILGYAAIGMSLTSQPGDVARIFPTVINWLFPVIGICTVMSPFVNLSRDLTETLHLDAGVARVHAVAFVVFVPFVLLFLTSRSFLGTIGFVGAFLTAFNSLIVCLIALVARKRSSMFRKAFIPLFFGAVYLMILLQRLFL